MLWQGIKWIGQREQLSFSVQTRLPQQIRVTAVSSVETAVFLRIRRYKNVQDCIFFPSYTQNLNKKGLLVDAKNPLS